MIKKHKSKIIAGFIIILSLVVAFFQGEDIPEKEIHYEISQEESVKEPVKKEEVPEEIPAELPEEVVKEEKTATLQETEPKKNPAAVEEEKETIKGLSCTLSVKCDTILNNTDKLNPDKSEIIPSDGIVFAEQTVTFYEGESVFNLLVREMKKNKIHLEFVNTPIYNSAYIEGIANLYENDCGDNSGWVYMVNGQSPSYGCSNYQLKAGDKVEWIYSCDLGKDVGGYYAD